MTEYTCISPIFQETNYWFWENEKPTAALQQGHDIISNL